MAQFRKYRRNHLVVASLETNTEFQAVSQAGNCRSVEKATFPMTGVTENGDLKTEGLPGAQQARPMLFREKS